MEDFLILLDRKSLLALSLTNKNYREQTLKILVEQKLGDTFLSKKPSRFNNSQWYLILIYYLKDPIQTSANKAAKAGLTYILDILKASKSITPDKDGLYEAMLKDRKNAIDWAIQNGIKISKKLLNLAVIKGVNWLKYFIEKGYIFTSKAIDTAIYFDKPESFTYLLSKGLIPGKEAIIHAASSGYLFYLKLLKTKGILPSSLSLGLNLAIKNNHPTTADWLLSQGIFPTKDGIEYALLNPKMLNLLTKYRIAIY